MKSNLTRRKDGSYVLKHKTTKAKKGDCKGCGHIVQYLTDYSKAKSVTPIWCDDCKALIEYSVELNNEKRN